MGDNRGRMRVVGALLLAALVEGGCSGNRATLGESRWNADQRSVYIHGCMNGDAPTSYGPTAVERYCNCYQARVEELHPYSWAVDGRPLTPAESEEIQHVEDRCREGVFSPYGAG